MEMAPTKKLVMLAIATRASKDGLARMRYQQLLEDTGLKDRSVREVLKSAEERGQLRIQRRKGGVWKLYLVTASPAEYAASPAVISRVHAGGRGLPESSVPSGPLPPTAPPLVKPSIRSWHIRINERPWPRQQTLSSDQIQSLQRSAGKADVDLEELTDTFIDYWQDPDRPFAQTWVLPNRLRTFIHRDGDSRPAPLDDIPHNGANLDCPCGPCVRHRKVLAASAS